MKFLTGQHSGEEDVVGEGDEAALSQAVKYTVLVRKPLPLVGNFLLIQTETAKKDKVMALETLMFMATEQTASSLLMSASQI